MRRLSCLADDAAISENPRARESVARLFSAVLSPPLMVGIGSVLMLNFSGRQHEFGTALNYTGLALGLPLLYLVFLKHSGQVDDFDLPLREQRLKPFLAAVLGLASGALYVHKIGAPSALLIFATASFLGSALALLITSFWKISIHSAAIGIVGVASTWLRQDFLTLFLSCSLLGAVGWSRVFLGRHSPAQIVAGGVLAITAFWLSLSLSAL